MTVDLAKLTALAGAVREREKARPTSTTKPWKIKNQGDEKTVVYIYEDIGKDWYDEGVGSLDFARDFDAITTPEIEVRFNSMGGHVFEGVAIYNTIKRHTSKTKAIIDGIAASAASFIAMACDEVWMEKTAKMMIHDAGVGSFYVAGTAAELRASMKDLEETAHLLDELSNTIAEIYADKAGGTVEEWRATMSAGDKWYSADQALAAGLSNGTIGQEPIKNPEPENTWSPTSVINEWKGFFA